MRNILALVAAAALVFAGVGWYLGWYEISRTTDSDGHQNINIDLNNQKISEDLKKGEQKLHDLISQKDKDSGVQHVTPPPPPPVPVTPSLPAPTIPTGFSTPPTATSPPPPPPVPSTQLPVRSNSAPAPPGTDILPVEFAPLPVPPPAPSVPPSVPLPLPPR